MSQTEPTLDGLLPVLVEGVPDLLQAVRVALADDWPDYAEFLAENSIEIGVAAEAALSRLVLLAGSGESEATLEQEMFEEIGRTQWRLGQDLMALLSAYQTGARVFWRKVSQVAVDRQVDSASVAGLAESVFAFVDRLSSATARGYVLEQSEAGAARERLRDELVGLLLSDRATHAAVQAAADRADWTVPDEVAVVLLPTEDPAAHRVLARLDPVHLAFNRPPLMGAIIGFPSRVDVRRRLLTALGATTAVVGVGVPADKLPASLPIARTAARLQRTGLLTDRVVFAVDHLDAIIVHRDDALLSALRRHVLAPLDGASPGSRERLCETLASWLRHMGDRHAVAAELHVHPQTVRYRLTRLHELFGDALDDPAVRSQMLLALGWGVPRQ